MRHGHAWAQDRIDPGMRPAYISKMPRMNAKPKNERDPLLAAICHDLRAPLAAVTMGANFVLQTTPEESARQRRILEAMLRSCAQMERLVRNFADLSEIEGNGVVLRLGVHDVGEMLELTAEGAEENAHGRRVTIEVDKPERGVTVRCDRERVLRALEHLVENALKFAPEGSAIALSAVRRDGEVVFQVTDHGPGLEPDVKKNLFRREFHAERAKRVGAGFGLAIARGFAAAHGGRVEVASEPGTSTIATFAIPAEGPAVEQSA
jgi:signal transduction histidine kinase